MTPILETDRDREIERRVIERILEDRDDLTPLRLPRLAFCDYLISGNGEIVGAVEIKSRKETSEQVRKYGGLMLKERKFLELREFTRTLYIPSIVAFAFSNGEGDIYFAEPTKIGYLEAVTPPPRRNYRGLPCDDEPVVYLDWDKHLRRVK